MVAIKCPSLGRGKQQAATRRIKSICRMRRHLQRACYCRRSRHFFMPARQLQPPQWQSSLVDRVIRSKSACDKWVGS